MALHDKEQRAKSKEQAHRRPRQGRKKNPGADEAPGAVLSTDHPHLRVHDLAQHRRRAGVEIHVPAIGRGKVMSAHRQGRGGETGLVSGGAHAAGSESDGPVLERDRAAGSSPESRCNRGPERNRLTFL